MRSPYLVILLGLLLINTPAFAQNKVSIFDTYEEALQAGIEGDKHVVLYFYADGWSAPETLNDILPENDAIRPYLIKNYVAVNVNADTDYGKLLSDQYNTLRVFPSIGLVRNDKSKIGYLSLLGGRSDETSLLTFFLRTDLYLD